MMAWSGQARAGAPSPQSDNQIGKVYFGGVNNMESMIAPITLEIPLSRTSRREAARF